MRSVEFKAELRDPALAAAACRALGATPVAELDLTDTHFRVTTGRLKRRDCPDEPVEYILYDRPSGPGPRLCHFAIYSERAAVQRFGRIAPPIDRVVRTRRCVLFCGPVRIHIDRVEGAGAFLELEVLVTRALGPDAAYQAISRLRAQLAPILGEPIAGSYADLLA